MISTTRTHSESEHMRRKPNNGKMHNNNRRRYGGNGGGRENNAGKIKNATANRDKYQNLARDAMASGDRVEAENFLQHAEHYYRVLSILQEEDNRNRPERNNEQNTASAEAPAEANAAESDGNSDDSDDDAKGNMALAS